MTATSPDSTDRSASILLKSDRAARMPHLLQHRGEAALAHAMRRAPLLGFDFDGTLAPIVPRPEQARVSESIAGKLRRMAAVLPVAVVSGRSASDVGARLGFEPAFVVGNHGAELEPMAHAHGVELDPVRELLRQRADVLHAAGVTIEDKGLSLALHYRCALRPAEARQLVQQTLEAARGLCRTFSGKMVENVVPRGAPDKARAMHLLLARTGASCAVFFGDDVNDEPVFAAAPPDWVTVRIGREDRNSCARFFLDHPAELGLVLDRMLACLPAT